MADLAGCLTFGMLPWQSKLEVFQRRQHFFRHGFAGERHTRAESAPVRPYFGPVFDRLTSSVRRVEFVGLLPEAQTL